MASTSGVDLSVSGLASGFDWKATVQQLAQAERAPQQVWLKNQSTINKKNSAFTIIKSYLSQLQNTVKALKEPSLYEGRAATSSTSTVATASAATGSASGTYNFNISQLATAGNLTGTGNISSKISSTNDVSGVTLGSANFPTSLTPGTFSVNGKQISVVTTDSLQAVFDKIATATSNAVTAAYDSSTDKITLTSGSAITLGSAADTSNFLQLAKLYNNNSGSVTSTDSLGRVTLADKLANADLATAVNDGGSGAGAFKINGVSINFNTTTDSVQNVLDRINASAAGVTATYDSVNNRFSLANKSTGDVGLALEDVTGNFLTATGLIGASFTRGQDLKYTVNGGPVLVSRSNAIDGSSSGITGLTVNAATTGSTSVTITTDTSAAQQKFQDFVTAYNNLQSYITANSASSTDATGKVTAGVLTGDLDAAKIATALRNNTFSPAEITGLSATFSVLATLGIKSNGNNNTVTLDSSKLSNVLTNNLGEVKELFTNATKGIGERLNKFLDSTIGDSGTLTNHQTALTKQSKAIDTQIANLEKQIAADVAFWTSQFRAMESAQAKNNQDLAYLNKTFK